MYTHAHAHAHTECPLFYEDPLGAEKTCCLLSHLLCCLHKCFLHNQAAPTTSFLTRERFDTLMPPLVHQVRKLQLLNCFKIQHSCVCQVSCPVSYSSSVFMYMYIQCNWDCIKCLLPIQSVCIYKKRALSLCKYTRAHARMCQWLLHPSPSLSLSHLQGE